MLTSAIIAASLAVLNPGGPETPMSVANKMSKDYEKAMMAKDAGYFEKGSTADFVYIDTKGRKQNKAQSIAGMKQGFNSMTSIKKIHVKVVSARRAEGGILFVGETKLVASLNTGGPKPSVMESTMRDETLAVPKNGRWLFKRVKMLKESTLVDGKPMPAM